MHVVLGACVGGHRAAPDAGTLAGGDPFDPAQYTSPAGEALAFGVHDANSSDDAASNDIADYFERQGSVSVHLLTRSGQHPRVIAAFPANNQGIGVWFRPVPEGAQLSLGAEPGSEPNARGGELAPLVRDAPARGQRAQNGVRATLVSSASVLSTELVLLGNVRTLRDYGYGACLENAAGFPEPRNESIELDQAHGTLRIRRELIGGAYSLELLLAGRAGTTLSLRPRSEAERPSCPLGEGGGQPIIVARGAVGVTLDLIVLPMTSRSLRSHRLSFLPRARRRRHRARGARSPS